MRIVVVGFYSPAASSMVLRLRAIRRIRFSVMLGAPSQLRVQLSHLNSTNCESIHFLGCAVQQRSGSGTAAAKWPGETWFGDQGLHALQQFGEAQLRGALDSLMPLKAGRPTKKGS